MSRLRGAAALLWVCSAAAAVSSAQPSVGRSSRSAPAASSPAALADHDAAACGRCHAATHAAWRESMHAASYTDPLFQAGYRVDHEPFCRDCHAPRGAGNAEPVGSARADGVDCVTCHVEGEVVLATNVTAAGQAAHPMRAAPELSDERACARCHEFQFPAHGGAYDPAGNMQRTVSEWRDHGAEPSCQSCHMPSGEHRVLGLRDEAFVRAALDVEVRASTRRGETLVAFSMRGAATGHAVPTGDMFRQLELRAWRPESPEVAARAELGRRFGPPPAALGAAPLVEREDLRVLPGQTRRYVLRVTGVADRVSWSVDLLRVDARHARDQGLDPSRLRVPLARGMARVRARRSPM